MGLFRELDEKEISEFAKWARENFNPQTDEINSAWHPVVQAECYKIIAETRTNEKD